VTAGETSATHCLVRRIALGRDAPGGPRGTDLDISAQTDEQLAALAAREASDGPAFQELLARYQDRVWRICYRLLSDAHDASDAAQEVFVRLFLSRAKFQGRSKYSTWVHGVAVRTCLTIRRGRTRRRQREAAAAQQTRETDEKPQGESTAELSLDLNQILNTLEDDDRALLIMKYAEGHNYDELATIFDLSISACKMRVARARQKLKERFPELDFGKGDD